MKDIGIFNFSCICQYLIIYLLCIIFVFMVESFFIFSFVLLMFVSAVVAMQMAYQSTLALRVKQLFLLSQPYSKTLLSLSRFKTWRRMIGTAFYFLLPLILVIVVLLRLHLFLSELLDCSMCSSTWILGLLLYFFTTETIIYCILFAPLAIVGVYILNRLRR